MNSPKFELSNPATDSSLGCNDAKGLSSTNKEQENSEASQDAVPGRPELLKRAFSCSSLLRGEF